MKSIQACRASRAASRSTSRSSPSSVIRKRSRMIRSPSCRNWRRRQGTSNGSSCSRDHGSKAIARRSPSASPLYPSVFPRPARNVEAEGETPVRTFTRQDGTPGRVVNLELRDESGFCRFVLWDDDVGLVERGKVAVGVTVRALDCYVKRTNFGLDVGRGKFGALVVEGA